MFLPAGGAIALLIPFSHPSHPPAPGALIGVQASEFKRRPLNLVLLLDVSGSMGSAFDAYYYDQFGKQQNLTEAGGWQTAACLLASA